MRRDTPFFNFVRQEYPVLIGMFGLFVLLSVLSVFFLAGEKRREMLLIKYEIERTASVLFETYQGAGAIGDLQLDRVTGYGFYDHDGNLVAFWGNVPKAVNPREVGYQGTTYTYDRSDKTVALVRRLGLFSIIPSFEPLMPFRARASSLVCVKLEAGNLFRRQQIYEIGYVVIPVIIAGMVAMAAWFYYRNWTARRRLDAQKQLVRMGEVARTLSHEIKNPLSAISIQTGLLRRLLPEKHISDIGVIEEEVDRLRTLVERIGEFLRNPTGTQEVVNVHEFVKDLLARYDWNVHYSAQDGQNINIRVDPERFRSVLENLVKNALESGDHKSPVEVSVESHRNRICVCVVDDGVGVPEGDVEHLFDPFFTTKEKGSGIGLSISRRFVEAAGGTLTLVPRSPIGTEARVELPRHSG